MIPYWYTKRSFKIEIIFVDDGSEDNSYFLINQFIKSFKKSRKNIKIKFCIFFDKKWIEKANIEENIRTNIIDKEVNIKLFINDDDKRFTDTITPSTPQLLRLDATDTLSLRTHTFQGKAYATHFCVNLLAANWLIDRLKDYS